MRPFFFPPLVARGPCARAWPPRLPEGEIASGQGDSRGLDSLLLATGKKRATTTISSGVKKTCETRLVSFPEPASFGRSMATGWRACHRNCFRRMVAGKNV